MPIIVPATRRRPRAHRARDDAADNGASHRRAVLFGNGKE